MIERFGATLLHQGVADALARLKAAYGAGDRPRGAHVSWVTAMIDFAITDLLDDTICMVWLERHLHPDGFTCLHCGRANRRFFRQQKHFPAYRRRDCDGYSTLMTGPHLKRPANARRPSCCCCEG